MKRLLLTLLATIGLSATSFAADSDLYWYHLTSDHRTLGIFDDKDRFAMQKYCRAKDEDGIQKMLDEGRALGFKANSNLCACLTSHKLSRYGAHLVKFCGRAAQAAEP